MGRHQRLRVGYFYLAVSANNQRAAKHITKKTTAITQRAQSFTEKTGIGSVLTALSVALCALCGEIRARRSEGQGPPVWLSSWDLD